MNRIEHIIEPERLWLIWQPGESNGKSRRRHLVGEIVRSDNNFTFRYLESAIDFESAKNLGFLGYPAFKLHTPEHNKGVLDAFLRRIPPRSRDDFEEYLERSRLPSGFSGSDFALLGYTGAKLPGDGFELCADLAEANSPFEIILEIAGFRHSSEIKKEDLVIGDPVEFVHDPLNAHDSNAIAIKINGKMLGFVGRQYANQFHRWNERNLSVDGVIERINGTIERPLVYLFVTVK